MTKAYGKGPKGHATGLVSQVVRAKGYCERCGKTAQQVQLQHAHIVRRSYNSTRTDETNGWALCAQCHYLVDNFNDEHNALVDKTLGADGYVALREKAQAGVGKKVDWLAEVARLKAILADIQAAA